MPLPGPARPADRLHDLLSRLFARARLRRAVRGGLPLEAFHRAHKYLLMAHAPAAQKDLGRLVASGRSDAETAAAYARGFRAALSRPATRGGHANALQHVAGYFRDSEDEARRAAARDAVEGYRRGARGLAEVVEPLRSAAEAEGLEYLEEQVYLAPYPAPLLRLVRLLSRLGPGSG